ncbi:hypothetical protein [Micromonospora sp. CB01531]|uniref:hypothetical protein n=1 Tax=Micromonospora sp. CB01531 TaxID=1718947 RepID=UPI00093CF54E|nr:hypothetical protein [Micromonospora sp. CB01531]OKI47446.1 hypothetical protein A6A27_10245 [Micromonospora sp. CB01531]
MIWLRGHYWGTAAQIAHTRGSDITADRVRDWARRSRQPGDTLHGLLPGHHLPGRGRGTTWYRDDQAATVEAITRKTVEEQGGPARRGTQRAELTPAA